MTVHSPEHTSTSSEGRGWAWCGVLGGLIALVVIFFLSVALSSVDEALWKDNARYVEAIADKKTTVWIFQTGTSLAALLVIVFAAGLRRKLARLEPRDGLVPGLVFAGLLLVAALLLVGGGISTELYHALRQYEKADPDTIGANLGIYNTLAWVWAGAGLSAGAVAVAGFRRRTVGRGTAVFSAVMAALIALVQLVPLQYMALLPGALWIMVMGAVSATSKR
ncbi:hypothetical protein [Thermomonospora umbrina]|uniref:DUF4386 family protein n=1 Tax=Thermomonospora umbrina TaxID=111806 RepID=A0A3D9SP82_9ACTN|nr:hypothetical protein [Thermomonospora umbrina]REE97776.1 hypothetical protein DFJ69_3251 [Thermomonospora umbrina]